jgi:chemotaxis response regulator CheB
VAQDKVACECYGMPDHLFTTEDEEQVYEYYKCKICGSIIRIDICKKS